MADSTSYLFVNEKKDIILLALTLVDDVFFLRYLLFVFIIPKSLRDPMSHNLLVREAVKQFGIMKGGGEVDLKPFPMSYKSTQK